MPRQIRHAAHPFFLLALVVTALPAAEERPNILFILSDDHAAQAISAYGSRITKTPHIDRLAREGMLFKNCFVTNSICTPSRAVILTGKYSHVNGVRTLGDAFDGSQPHVAKLLQKAGYYTGVIGKWHLRTAPTGFDEYKVLPGQGDYFDPVFYAQDMPWWRGKGKRAEGKRYPGYVTNVTTDLALDFLERRPTDKPFLLFYQHKAPHDMWEYDDKHAHLYENEEVPEPGNLFDDYADRTEAIRRTTEKIGMEETLFLHKAGNGQFDGVREKIGHLPPREQKKAAYQIFIKAYLRCVAAIDDNIGRVLDHLDASGLSQNTIVIYTSDQGVFLGEHGLFDKRFMYEESLRMPFLVRYPGVVPAASTNGDIVTNCDFAETLLDFAGVPIPEDMQGRSLRPLLEGRSPADWQQAMYYRYWLHLPHFRVAAHYGLRTKGYKLIYYYGKPMGAKGAVQQETPPEWELFDLRKDPHEMKNVYNDPDYAGRVRILKKRLEGLRQELGDTR